MIYCLENERIKLLISDFGAEMISFKFDGFEYLRSPDEKYFNRVSPCLFPVTGRFMDGYYIHNGKKYNMPLNGFAMNKTFETKAISNTELKMTLREDEDSLKIYPYKFLLEIKYTLKDNSVKISYRVKNNSKEPMPYSIGNHTAYKWPLVDGDNPNSYFIRFEKNENLQSFSPFGWIDSYVSNDNIRPLSHDLYTNGTRSFQNQKSNWLEYTGANCDYVLRMYNKDIPFVANWARPELDAEFVCLEPSLSISSHGPTMFDREGIHILEPNETEATSYSLMAYKKS